MPDTYSAEVKELEGCWREIEFSFPPEPVEDRLERRISELRPKVKLPGFRPGKVPAHLVRRMYEKDVLEDIAIDLVQEHLERVYDENRLRPASPPRLERVQYDKGEALRVKVKIEVLPEFDLPDFSSLRVERPVIEVTDEDVEIELNYLRQREAIQVDIEEGAQPGDRIEATIRILDPSGLPLVGQEPQQVVLVIPDDKDESELDEADREFRSQLVGAKPGETRQLRLSQALFNWERGNPPFVYSVEVKRVYRWELPELDDEFAKDIGDFQTLDELRQHVRERLESQARSMMMQEFHRNIREEIVKALDFVPPKLFVDPILEDLKKAYRENYPEARIPEADLTKQLQPEAVKQAKWVLIRDRILEEYGLEVSEDDVDLYIEEMIKANPDRADELRKQYMTEEARKDLRYELETNRLYQFLAERVQTQELRRSFYARPKVDDLGEDDGPNLIRTPYEATE